MIDLISKFLVYFIAFIFSLILSSFLIRKVVPFIIKKNQRQSEIIASHSPWYFDVGFWIGFFEILIIFCFVLNREFSALAIIFGAKEFVRKEEIKSNPAYYLLGTFINFGLAIVFVLIGKEVLKLITC